MNTQEQDIELIIGVLKQMEALCFSERECKHIKAIMEAFSRILERTIPECVVGSRFIVEYKDKQECVYSPDDFEDKKPPRQAVLNAMKKMEEGK